MLPYRVGDHVSFKAGDSSLEFDDNDWVVVHIEGSELMLKRGHLVICGIHADQVAPSRASGDDASAIAREAFPPAGSDSTRRGSVAAHNPSWHP
jgi:hypothetical protein